MEEWLGRRTAFLIGKKFWKPELILTPKKQVKISPGPLQLDQRPEQEEMSTGCTAHEASAHRGMWKLICTTCPRNQQ